MLNSYFYHSRNMMAERNGIRLATFNRDGALKITTRGFWSGKGILEMYSQKVLGENIYDFLQGR
jgi:hypothetical protein